MRPILAGFDGTDPSRDALRLGGDLARLFGDPLEVVRVGRDKARPGQAVRDLAGPGVLPRVVDVAGQDVADGLRRRAHEAGARLIVVGSSRRGAVGRTMAGTVASQLLRDPRGPVATAPRGYTDRTRPVPARIVVAYDESSPADHALGIAARLAARAEVPLVVLEVVPTVPVPLAPWPSSAVPAAVTTESVMAVERRLDDLIARLGPAVMVERQVVQGEPAEAIAASLRPSDLLVLGTRGYGAMLGVLLGSVSRALCDGCVCPVLAIPVPEADAASDRAPARTPVAVT